MNEVPAPQIPTAAPVQAENPPPQNLPPAPPPAAHLVVNGEVKSERELKLEKDLRDSEDARRRAEVIAAEKEDEAARLRELQSQSPPPPASKPAKVKRSRLFPTLINTDPDDE